MFGYFFLANVLPTYDVYVIEDKDSTLNYSSYYSLSDVDTSRLDEDELDANRWFWAFPYACVWVNERVQARK